MCRARWTGVAASLAALAFASVARAQPAPPPGGGAGAGGDRPWAEGVSAEDQKAAFALFAEGNGFLRDGIFVKAAEKYREALGHWDHPAIHYNLALALVNLDQPIEMYHELEKAMAYGSAPIDEDKFRRAKDLKTLVEKQLANIEYSCSIPGSTVVFDGKEVFTGPGTWKQLIPAGEHAVLVRAEGYVASQANLKIAGGETVKQECQLFTEGQLLREKRLMPGWIPFSIGGTGLAIIGGGILLHLSAKSTFADYDKGVKDCAAGDPTGGCAMPPAGLFDKKSSAELKQNVAIGLYAVGGAALAAGVTLIVLNRPTTYRVDPKEINDQAFQLTPVLGPDLTGIAASGRF